MAAYENKLTNNLADPGSFLEGDTMTLVGGAKFVRQNGRWEPYSFSSSSAKGSTQLLTATTSDQGVGSGAAPIATMKQLYGEEELATSFDRELTRMEYDFRRRGRLGVGNKGAVAFRFDHHSKIFRDTFKPLVDTRGFPYQLNAHVTEFDGSVPDNPTWADAVLWQDAGMEFFTHGMTHDMYSPANYAGMKDDLLAPLAIAKANGMDVKGWAMPGLGDATAFDGLLVPDDWRGSAGRIIMSSYPLAEAYSGPTCVPITSEPNLYLYGRAHVTIETQTLGALKKYVDLCTIEKKSCRFMVHCGLIDKPGYITLTDYTAFLDYVVAQRDAGLLDIVLPSALPYITNSTFRLDLLHGAGTFAGLSDSNIGLWTKLGTTWNTISATGGYNNGPKVSILPGKYAPYYIISDCTRNGYAGEVFQFEGWCQGAQAGLTDTCQVIMIGPNDTTFIDKRYPGVGNGSWTPVRFNFRIPKTINGATVVDVQLTLGRYGGTSGTEWSNVTIKKV